MAAIALFLIFCAAAAICTVTGVFLLGGAGPALIVAGMAMAIAAAGLRRGMTSDG